jgi:SAM-dependent methyltransferase
VDSLRCGPCRLDVGATRMHRNDTPSARPASPTEVADAIDPSLRTIDAAELKRRKAALISEVGPWNFHNFHLRDGVFTMAPDARGDEWRLAPVMQCVSDLLGELEGLRVLDLGCMEGLFSIELARRGGRVVGVEGRESHLARARFAQGALGLDDLEFRLDDLRDLSAEEYGRFDLVLALGVLYHLDVPDAFALAHRIAEVCDRVAIIDTHYSLRPVARWRYGGSEYAGLAVREHDPSDDPGDRQRSFGSSIGNLWSTWLTKESLFNLLQSAGFSTVFELRFPRIYPRSDRVILAAIKGPGRPRLLSVPYHDSWTSAGWTEGERPLPSRQQRRVERALVRAAPFVPVSVRRRFIRRRRTARGT